MQIQQPILLIEDSPEDVEALTRTLHKLRVSCPLKHCASAEQALDYLKHQGPYEQPAQAPRPGLILLDLNMPGTDGRALLRTLKADESLRDIPVIVLSTSDNPRDVEFCYRHGASGYQVKPMDTQEQLHATRVMLEYWFDVALIPGRQRRRPS